MTPAPWCDLVPHPVPVSSRSTGSILAVALVTNESGTTKECKRHPWCPLDEVKRAMSCSGEYYEAVVT